MNIYTTLHLAKKQAIVKRDWDMTSENPEQLQKLDKIRSWMNLISGIFRKVISNFLIHFAYPLYAASDKKITCYQKFYRRSEHRVM